MKKRRKSLPLWAIAVALIGMALGTSRPATAEQWNGNPWLVWDGPDIVCIGNGCFQPCMVCCEGGGC